LIRRVRAGDQDAAADLVRTYEPAVRRAVRVRLSDSRLARAFDSADVCQSVLASFFVRTALGQYDLDTPEHLLRLLATIARHKLADQVDRQRAGCRDNRRTDEAAGDRLNAADPGPTPSREVAARDLLAEVRRRLSPEERRVADFRHQGYDWDRIAAELGGTA